jgi:hypothetical protein
LPQVDLERNAFLRGPLVASPANENHTIMVLVLVGILNARFIFTIATTKLFARIIFRAVLKFPHPALREFS